MSEFLRRKMRTYFALFDYDKDGVISKDDWMKMPALLASCTKADKKKTDHVKLQYENVWKQFIEGSDSADKKTLTAELLGSSILKQLHSTELKKRLSGLIHATFDVMDVNGDGYLQEDEYDRVFQNLGVPDTSFAKEAFRAIDVNHDEKLSCEEFDAAFWDFFTSKDPASPYTFFFGPLVD